MIKKISYYLLRIQQVLKQHGFSVVLQAIISRLIGKDYEFVKFALRKGRYLFRGSDTGFLMIKDIYQYRQGPSFQDQYELLVCGLDSDSRAAVDKFLRLNEIFYHNNIIHESKVFDDGSYQAQKNALRFMSSHGVLHPTGYYVLEDAGLVARIKTGDIIDCGACDGTESLMFAKFTQQSSKVYSFEPSSENFTLLCNNIANSPYSSFILPQQLGLGDKDEEVKIYGSSGGEVSKIDLHGDQQPTEIMHFTTIDNFKKKHTLKKISLIKWDIEGAEWDSIMGAEHTIKSDKPILIVSIYHNGKQFFEIKPLLESWNLGYQFKIVQSEPENSWAGYVLIAY